MQTLYPIVVAVLAVAVAMLVLAIMRPRGPTAVVTDREMEGRLAALQDAKNDLERMLAIEQHKASRIPQLERALEEQAQASRNLTDSKIQTELALATAREAQSRIETAMMELKARFSLLETSRDEMTQRTDLLRAEKGRLEEMLAAKAEAILHAEASIGELRDRLDARDQDLAKAGSRLELAARGRSELEATLATRSETVTRLDETIRDLRERLEASEQNQAKAGARLDVAARGRAELESTLATLREALDQERNQSREKLALLTEARDRMTQEFKLLATDVMKVHGETFSKQNQEQIDALLHPLRLKIGEFQQGLQQASAESTRERATLAEQIRMLSETSGRMSAETANLTRALKGEAQTQGAWGEMILASILEKSGLRTGEEYVVQQSHADDAGQRLRPDVIVRLPGGQKVVIDSKVSLVAFDAYIAAESDGERIATLARHIASMKSHIRGLSTKEYHAAVGSGLDYVVMFIPIEGALALALQQEPTLTAFAVENNVAIATPTTLMIALRTVANIWQVERRNQNAEAIAIRAGRIYDKLVGFLDDMTTVGVRLAQVQDSYSGAMNKLSTGRGNLVGQVAALKTLGARTSKSIPPALIDESDAELVESPAEAEVGE